MLFKSNAKVNFGLAVGNKRKDGFHEIESIILPVHDYCDWIEILPNKHKTGIEFTTSGIAIPGKISDNLCVSAYNLIAEKYNIPGILIHLHKNIAIGNGYGGGSSNAVTVLCALNQIFNLEIDKNEMQMFAEELGSDCPFFLVNKPSLVGGRGELVEEIKFDFGEFRIVVYPSKIHVNTSESFNLKSFETGSIITLNKLEDVENWKINFINSFESELLSKHRDLLSTKNRIYEEGALFAGITGTGAGMFGIFKL